MCSMARRLSSLARVPLLSLPSTKSTSMSMSISSRRCFSMSLRKLRDRPPVFVHPIASPRRQQGLASPSTNSAAKTEELLRFTWTKRLNISEHLPDDRNFNLGYTIFTSPGATKNAVLVMMNRLEMSPNRGDAAVVLASPRHASWLTDNEFMARLVEKLHGTQPGVDTKVHILVAVFDGLYPQSTGREMQEGLSIQFGNLDRLLPGLWDEATDKTLETQSQHKEPGSESAHVSVVLRRTAYRGETHRVNLPLANTLFHNGRRTTLLASEWLIRRSGVVDLLRMTQKQSQKIDLPMLPSGVDQKIQMRCPLVPITHPRRIVEGLGNILAKVDIKGQPSPASQELQINIPRLLEARQSRSDHDPATARIGVWALIIPARLVTISAVQRGTPDKRTKQAHCSFNPTISTGKLGAAVDKLAFEMTSVVQRTAWQRSNVLGDILLQGGRLHKILSGGGEWGAKASLLSLDPQTSYGVQSEDDELDRFQRSFHGEDVTEGAIIRPGDYVQFFVEGDAVVAPDGRGPMMLMRSPASLPRAAFGVGEFSKEEHAPQKTEASIHEQQKLVRLAPDHFGAFSAEGLYLEMRSEHVKEKTTTKVNTPGTVIYPLSDTPYRFRPDPSVDHQRRR